MIVRSVWFAENVTILLQIRNENFIVKERENGYYGINQIMTTWRMER